MTFGNPQLLLLLAVVPVAAGLVGWAYFARKRALSRFGDPVLVRRLIGSVNTPWQIARSVLMIAAIALVVLAAARPQWGETEQIVERHGVQLMVALDISRSMLAEDVRPDRLSRAKLEAADLLERLHGDEVGLVLFSGAAFIQFPLTFDYATARTFLDRADTEMIGLQGTVIDEAISVSMVGLNNDRVGHKAIVIISDGEDDQQESDYVRAANRAADAGLTVFTIGVGTTEGEPIPVKDTWGNLVGYQEDGDGNMVLSRINEDVLKSVAEAGGGRYVLAGGSTSAAAVIAEELDRLEKTVVESEITNARIERFQWFAIGAIALLAASLLIPSRRRISPVRAPSGTSR